MKVLNKKFIVAAVASLGLMANPALAFASTPAAPSSCMGKEAAALSPRGSSEEFPGGMAELNAYFLDLGVTPGSAYHLFASLHEGSHEACDEAFE